MSVIKLAILLFLGSIGVSRAQSVYVLNDSNRIFTLNMSSCDLQPLHHLDQIDPLTDLAIDSSGNMYGISELGNLFEIHQDGATSLLHSFLLLQSFHALWCDDQGMIFTSGSEGFLYAYDLSTGQDKFLGDVGFLVDGDLIRNEGQLYASGGDQGMIKVELANLSASSIVLRNDETSRLQGLFNFNLVEDPCSPPKTFGISDQGQVIVVDLVDSESIVHCQLNILVRGATSNLDFESNLPLRIDNLIAEPSQCKTNSGKLSLLVSGGTGVKYMKVDDESIFADSIIGGLRPGRHQLEIWDENNCTIDTSFLIILVDTPKIADVVIANPSCDLGQGTILVEAVGKNPFLFQIDDSPMQDTNYFSGVVSGDYLLKVFDDNGCAGQRMLTINKSNGFAISEVEITPAKCLEPSGSVLIKMREQRGDLVYRLAGTTSIEPFFKDLDSGMFLLEISDELGCKIDTLLEVGQSRCGIFIPEAFSPNKDGINELFRLYSGVQMDFRINTYQILNRWGGQIFLSSDFSNHSEDGWWDGQYDGRPAAVGSYMYLITITTDDGGVEKLSGIINLVR